MRTLLHSLIQRAFQESKPIPSFSRKSSHQTNFFFSDLVKFLNSVIPGDADVKTGKIVLSIGQVYRIPPPLRAQLLEQVI